MITIRRSLCVLFVLSIAVVFAGSARSVSGDQGADKMDLKSNYQKGSVVGWAIANTTGYPHRDRIRKKKHDNQDFAVEAHLDEGKADQDFTIALKFNPGRKDQIYLNLGVMSTNRQGKGSGHGEADLDEVRKLLKGSKEGMQIVLRLHIYKKGTYSLKDYYETGKFKL
jgi:hypothetical protein